MGVWSPRDPLASVPTPYGDGRLDVHAARGATVTLLLSHGAGNGVESRDLAALAAALPRHGVTVALFEQPWRVAGKKIASPPPTLDVGLRAARARCCVRGRRSSSAAGRPVRGPPPGARRELGADGCLALSFPLHPPGRPEKSRVDELTGAGVPTLVVQGERDSMGRPGGVPRGHRPRPSSPPPTTGSGCRRRGPLSQAEALEVVVEAVLEWLVREVTGNP